MLTRSFSARGRLVDHPTLGFAIPLEIAAANLSQFAPFLPPPDRRLLPKLSAGEAALGATSARLRLLGPGGELVFDERKVRVAGVVPDADIGAHELFVSRRTAAELGVRRNLYMLVDPAPGTPVRALAARIRSLLPPSASLRVRAPRESRYLRQADAVLAPVEEKEIFGEFAARPTPAPGGWLTLDPAWVHRYIVTASVPILGRVSCNRTLIPKLRGALAELERKGLGHLVHPHDYGGCYAPRLIPGLPGEAISHHAWGSAIDINVSSNPFGQRPHQDPRLVAAFERWGFIWGGRFVVPVGMHFEYLGAWVRRAAAKSSSRPSSPSPTGERRMVSS